VPVGSGELHQSHLDAAAAVGANATVTKNPTELALIKLQKLKEQQQQYQQQLLHQQQQVSLLYLFPFDL
jgi:hypothetical protein